MSDKVRYEHARKVVRAKFDFYGHLGVYIIVMVFLAVLNHIVSPSRYWFIWPLAFWGLAVAIHGFSVLLKNCVDEIVEDRIQKELSKKRFGR